MDGITQPFGQQLSAGDRWSWLVSLADYPATLWRLTYAFRGPSKLDVVGVASGNDHQLDAVPATTTKLQPGTYGWAQVVDNIADATLHFELARGTVEILPDILKAGADGATDFRSQNRRILDAIKKTIEGTASREEHQYQVGGRSLQVRTIDELTKLEGIYAARVRKEEIAAGTASPNSNAVHVRFGSTS